MDEQPEKALPFFSRAIVSEWFSGLIFSDPVPTIRQIELTRREYLFGLRINTIHRYEMKRVQSGRWTLTLYYTGSQEEGLRKLGLEYIRENGRLVIDFLDYDEESYGPPPDNVIDRF
ncbi:MAG: hypothetical protein WB812_11385 [Woeseiaceae bacterium]